MTYKELADYTPFSQIVLTILPLLSADDQFITDFQTFAPYISSDIVSYIFDPSCSCKSKVMLYSELYLKETSSFLYNYVSSNDLMDLLDSVVVKSTIQYAVNIAGKVAVTTIPEWTEFTVKASSAQYNSYSVALSGDKVIVFFK